MADLKIQSVIEILLKGKGDAEALKVLRGLEAQSRNTRKRLQELGQGGREAQAGLDKAAASARATKASLDSTEKAGRALGQTLTRFLGAAAIGAFVKSSIGEFARLDRAFTAIETRLDAVGLASAKNLTKVRAFLEGLGAEKLENTTQAFQRFIGITKDVDAALTAVGLAVDISETGMIGLSGAADAMVAILQGRAKSAANALGIELNKVSGAAKTNAELIDEVIQTFEGFSTKGTDAQEKLDALAAAFVDLKRDAGEGLAGLLGVLGGIGKVVNAFKTLGTVVAAGGLALLHTFKGVFAGVSKIAQGIGEALTAAFDFRTLILSPDSYKRALAAAINPVEILRNAGNAMSKHADEALATLAAVPSAIGELWKKEAAGEVQTEDEKQKALKALRDIAAKASADEEAKAAATRAAKRADLEQRAEEDAIQARIQAAAAGSEKRLQLELDLIEKKRTAALADAKALGADLQTINESFDLQRAAKEQEHADQLRERAQEDEENVAHARVEAAESGSRERFDLEMALLDSQYRAAIAAAEKEGRSTTAIRLAHELERRTKTLDMLREEGEERLRLAEELAEAEGELREAQEEDRLSKVPPGSSEAFQLLRDAIDAKEAAEVEALDRERQRALEDGLFKRRTAEQTSKAIQAIDARETAAHLRASTERREIDAAEALARVQKFLAAAQAVLTAAEGAFGEHKAFQMAQAIINTARAVTEVLPNVPLAAAIAAMGAIQIAKIASTNPGSGSSAAGAGGATASTQSGPQSGQQLAAAVGQTQAPPGGFINVGGGAVAAGPVTNSYDQRSEVHNHYQFEFSKGAYVGRRGMKQLTREIKKTITREGSRLLR